MNKRKEWKDYDIVRPEDAQRWEDKPDLEEIKTIVEETAGSGGSSEVVEEVKGDLDDHLNDKDNPHEVTAEQVGAYTKEETDDLLSIRDDRFDYVVFAGTEEEWQALNADEKAKYIMRGVVKS